ncbi:amidohydrolase family protein [Paraburkholderia sp. BCC1886]|uniref:amidohydrolase family protein n=1 Tax=Paraburkholderia sp. BCC1886 TaxID=2562670 RepID=UPI0011821FB0|nr:amidohydrolase family protein [Paraburkholderia sp. BCC1886]
MSLTSAFTAIEVDHVTGLDGADQGAATIEVGPSGEILAVRPAESTVSRETSELSAIPLLADSHAHLGISDGVTESPEFHTLAHVDAQLRHLAVRGVGHILSLGTDQRWLQKHLGRRLASGEASDKAFGYSAGVGFGAVNGWPPEMTCPELRFRPVEPELARRQVRELAGMGCRVLKIWVDDFGGTVPKIPLEVVRAIVDEARQCSILTFAHVHFHRDARALVDLGIGVLAHSIRDQLIDAALIDSMAKNAVTLVPTLSREEAELAFSLEDNPYMNNEFFLSSERDLVPLLRGKKFSDNPQKPAKRLEIALENVARAHTAGIPIALGTDSGFKMKLQGFAQHRELQLMNKAGMSPAECLKAALQNNQRLFATGMTAIVAGEPASFFIVKGNVQQNIRTTEDIVEIWVSGKRLSGPDLLPGTELYRNDAARGGR